MDTSEFIIVLTQHRYLGNIFMPYLIEKKDKFYSIESSVTHADFETIGYPFKPYEKKLVEIIEKYSDKSLMKKFSREEKVTDFFSNLESGYFEKYISPFIGQCMFEVVKILMLTPVKLYNRGVKYANLYDEDEIYVQSLFAKPVFLFERTGTETRYCLKVFQNKREIPLQNRNIKIISNDPCLLIHQNRLIPFEKLDAKKLIPFFNKEYVSIPNTMEDRYYSGFIRKVIRNFEVKAKGFQISDGGKNKSTILTLENNLRYEPCFVLNFKYDDHRFLSTSTREVIVQFYKQDDEYIFRKIKRDYDWEKQVLKDLSEVGLRKINGFFSLSGLDLFEREEALYYIINWLSKNKILLENKGIKVEQGKLEKNFFTGEQHIEVITKAKDDWFDVYATVTFGSFSFPFIKLKNYILNGIREFELPNGEIAIIPEEWFARYKSLLPFAKRRGDRLQFGRYHYALLQHILQPGSSSLPDKLIQLSGVQENVKLPDGLNAQLRRYQKEGFRWMFGLYKNDFGGCLADDMGLGKTLQTLALLLKLKRPERIRKVDGQAYKPRQLVLFSEIISDAYDQPASLIVVPTSLIHNWDAEIKKFTPLLKVYKHTGSQRKKNSELQDAVANYDVILTTYGILRNDIDTLSRIRFFYLILDESQYVKNPSSKTYKAVIRLKGGHRLVLTGTPIENSLSDVWAQMNFLNREMLGNLPFFRRYFITPIEKHNNKEQQEKLQILIRPFVLRRTKDEVARDLPPLMEQVILCEMDEKQQRTYEIEKSVIRNSILAGIEKDGINKSAMVILSGLTRLRQLANHPMLLDDFEEGKSGKFEELFRMLENVVAENHKVLVFSSFVKHLGLIRSRIEKEKWKFSMLTGQTTNREEVIRHFQEDPKNRIFLISLKAGGVGLNLTSADYVFIIDPWWNPAAEDQAISRAHRIGQSKHVFVYRFITQNSIEEKIQHLQSRKITLANKFINTNNPLQEVTKEEIISLFK